MFLAPSGYPLAAGIPSPQKATDRFPLPRMSPVAGQRSACVPFLPFSSIQPLSFEPFSALQFPTSPWLGSGGREGRRSDAPRSDRSLTND